MNQANPKLKWLSQRDNLNPWTKKPEPYNQCMVSSFTMMVQWLRDYLTLIGLETFENYDEMTHYIVVGKSAEEEGKIRFYSTNHAKELNKMFANYKTKIPFRLVQKNFNYIELKMYVNLNKKPVLLGTMETRDGHIVCYDGLIQNPYGKPSYDITNTSCKYISENGADLDYSDLFFEKMVFRSVDYKTNTTVSTNTKRPCWVFEEIK